MTSLERFERFCRHQHIDEPLHWLGIPTPQALPKLLEYFQANDEIELKNRLGDDIYPVEVAYNNPPINHIACAFDWHPATDEESYTERSLTTDGFFAHCSDVNRFPWPDPAAHIDIAGCIAHAAAVPAGKVGLGVMWSAHFQDACAAFGMENALMQMALEPELFQQVIDRIVEFYLEANEIFYRAVKGRIHAVLLGNDLGTQLSLIISPEMVRRFVLPGVRKLITQAHGYGLKVIYHSCGSIHPIIPDLVECGADIIHPIQARASGMSAVELKEKFGDRYLYCGGVDVQELLVNGSADQVRAEVKRLLEIFPDNLILSPSHEAILPDVPPENIEALYRRREQKLK